MDSSWSAILIVLLTAVVYIFLAVRLRLFSDHETDGGVSFSIGGVLVFVAAVWYLVTMLPEYYDWFITPAYLYISIAHFAVFLIGLLLTVVGLSLYADSWQMRAEDLSVRHEKMSLLRNLQRDAREPYHLLQLLDIAIKEVVGHMPQSSGALFLLNRKRRQLVLAASVGFNKQEQASLEQYPLERNVVGQSLDLGDPFLAEGYELIQQQASTRFRSGVVLPLISGTERIGVIVLVSEQEHRFSSADLDYLSPVGEWLAEKIKSARLNRELVSVKKDLESERSVLEQQHARLSSSVASFGSTEPVDAYCRSLVGLVGSDAVFLVAETKGALEFTGGSEPLVEPGESLKSSLVDALDRDKPLIINQEATTEEGRSYVSQSVLVVPLTAFDRQYGLVLRKSSGVISVSEQELKTIQLYARLAGVLVRQRDAERLDLRRRKGLQRVLQLLRFDSVPTFDREWSFFAEHMSDVLPRGSISLTFALENDSLVCRGMHRENDEHEVALSLEPLSTPIAGILQGEPKFVYGKQAVGRLIDDLDRDGVLRELLAGDRRPVHVALCPIRPASGIDGLVLFVLYDLSEQERGELERLLQLSLGLYTTALSVHELSAQPTPVDTEVAPSDGLDSSIVNDLNNRLSAILGSAELVLKYGELPSDIRTLVDRIVHEAEDAGRSVRVGKIETDEPDGEEEVQPSSDSINQTVEDVLSSSRISGDLYMIGGQPREVVTRFSDTQPVTIESAVLKPLFEEALNRFASVAEGSDVITVSTYADDTYVYVDVSRHPKNFPAADRIAGFGAYEPASRVLGYRPTDAFLKTISEYDEAFYAYDRYQDAPAYLSFRFPAAGAAKQDSGDEAEVPDRLKVLAVDDQEIILDLIAAMCRSLGYEVVTATSATEGVRLGTERKFDIVLTDLAMPEISGLQLGREIHGRWPDIPIVLITGWESDISDAELARAGIRHVLHKPFRMEQLTDLIETLTKSNQPS